MHKDFEFEGTYDIIVGRHGGRSRRTAGHPTLLIRKQKVNRK